MSSFKTWNMRCFQLPHWTVLKSLLKFKEQLKNKMKHWERFLFFFFVITLLLRGALSSTTNTEGKPSKSGFFGVQQRARPFGAGMEKRGATAPAPVLPGLQTLNIYSKERRPHFGLQNTAKVIQLWGHFPLYTTKITHLNGELGYSSTGLLERDINEI